MTMPEQNATTTDGVEVGPLTSAAPTSELSGDFLCDYDGARLNVIGRNTVGAVTYEVRECSSNPDHSKQVPI